jgi:hypothetical protein
MIASMNLKAKLKSSAQNVAQINSIINFERVINVYLFVLQLREH